MDNITLVSLLLVVLLYIPGHLFKRFYYKGPFVQQFYFGIFAERFITSVFWGIVMQIFALLVSKKFIDFSYDNLKKPISEFYTNLCSNKLPDLTFDNICNIGVYFLITICVSVVMGFFSFTTVRLLRIDHFVSALRFQNQWHYYFKGEGMDTPDSSNLGSVISTDIDLLTKDGESTKLYSGFLKSYTISIKTGELETITITSASRYSNSRQTYIPIKGDCLIIPFEKIVNFNLRFNRAKRVPFKEKFISYFVLVFLVIEVFFYFYIPIHYSNLGLGKIISAIIIFTMAIASFQLACLTPLIDIVDSTKKSKRYVAIFFIILSMISAMALFLLLGYRLHLTPFQIL